MDPDGQPSPVSVSVRERPCPSLPFCVLVADAALSLLNLVTHFLDRQMDALARRLEQEGGFSERLYRVRTARRKEKRYPKQPPKQ